MQFIILHKSLCIANTDMHAHHLTKEEHAIFQRRMTSLSEWKASFGDFKWNLKMVFICESVLSLLDILNFTSS